MKDDSCIFCKIIAHEIPAEIIHETDDVIAFVDTKPTNFGHSLVMLKAHYPNIYSIPDELLGTYFQEIKRISNAVKKSTNADGINVHINNDAAAGQLIFHSHVHVIPRFFDDGLIHFTQKHYENPEQMKEIGEKIRATLTS